MNQSGSDIGSESEGESESECDREVVSGNELESGRESVRESYSDCYTKNDKETAVTLCLRPCNHELAMFSKYGDEKRTQN